MPKSLLLKHYRGGPERPHPRPARLTAPRQFPRRDRVVSCGDRAGAAAARLPAMLPRGIVGISNAQACGK
jgi:hypothetical protein